MSETKLQRFVRDTTAFWHRHKPRVENSGILVGGMIGSSATATDIIELGIAGKSLSIWHGVKFVFFFTLSCCHSWKLLHDTPSKANSTVSGKDPEGHLK